MSSPHARLPRRHIVLALVFASAAVTILLAGAMAFLLLGRAPSLQPKDRAPAALPIAPEADGSNSR